MRYLIFTTCLLAMNFSFGQGAGKVTSANKEKQSLQKLIGLYDKFVKVMQDTDLQYKQTKLNLHSYYRRSYCNAVANKSVKEQGRFNPLKENEKEDIYYTKWFECIESQGVNARALMTIAAERCIDARADVVDVQEQIINSVGAYNKRHPEDRIEMPKFVKMSFELPKFDVDKVLSDVKVNMKRTAGVAPAPAVKPAVAQPAVAKPPMKK